MARELFLPKCRSLHGDSFHNRDLLVCKPRNDLLELTLDSEPPLQSNLKGYDHEGLYFDLREVTESSKYLSVGFTSDILVETHSFDPEANRIFDQSIYILLRHRPKLLLDRSPSSGPQSIQKPPIVSCILSNHHPSVPSSVGLGPGDIDVGRST